MITVNDRWVIQVDDYNYTVCKNKPTTSVKDGKTSVTYPSKAYCRSLQEALEFISDEEVRTSLAEGDKSLPEAVSAVRGVLKEMREIISRVLEDDRK